MLRLPCRRREAGLSHTSRALIARGRTLGRDAMSLTDLQSLVRRHRALAVFFGAPNCGICVALAPKLLRALNEQFPRLIIEYVNTSIKPEVAAQFDVFSIPTLLVFFEGKESLRASRVMGVTEVVRQIHRPYELLFASDHTPPRP